MRGGLGSGTEPGGGAKRGMAGPGSFRLFCVNEELVLPGTIQHPLTPVDSVEAIPNMDGFFLLAPPFPDCPDPEPGPDEPDEPGEPGGDDWDLTLPCGKRLRA